MTAHARTFADVEAALVHTAWRWYQAAAWLTLRRGEDGDGPVPARMEAMAPPPAPKARRVWLLRLRARLSGLLSDAEHRYTAAYCGAVAYMVQQGDALLWELVNRWSAFAWKHVRRVEPHADLQRDAHQHLLLAMHEAATRFDPAAGRFTTYANWHALRAMNDPDPKGAVVHIPGQERWRVRRAQEVLDAGVPVAEAAIMLRTTPSSVRAILRAGAESVHAVDPWDAEGVQLAQREDVLLDGIDRERLSAVVIGEIDQLQFGVRDIVCLFYGIRHPQHNALGLMMDYASIDAYKGCTKKWVQSALTQARRDLRQVLTGWSDIESWRCDYALSAREWLTRSPAR